MKGQIRALNALLTCRQGHEGWLRMVMGGVGVEEGGKEGRDRDEATINEELRNCGLPN